MGSFFESYGLLIILIVAFALIMLSYYFRNKKFQDNEQKFQTALKKGDRVKTYSGFYGEVEKISETTDGKVVTLKLGTKSYIDVDIRAISGLDAKRDISEIEAEELLKAKQELLANEQSKVEEVKAEIKEETVKQPETVVEEKPIVVKPKAKRKSSKKESV